MATPNTERPTASLLRPMACALVLLLSAAGPLPAQSPGSGSTVGSDSSGSGPGSALRTVRAVRAEEGIRIDGRLDERVWRAAPAVAGFWLFRPVDGEPAPLGTEARVAYDDRSLYVAFRARQGEGSPVRASLSDRDDIFADDIIGILLDTFGDERRAYEIFVNPFGVQGDAVLSEESGEDQSVDLVWESAGRRTEEGYAVEIAIPFRSLRFPESESHDWRVAFTRVVQARSEQYAWPRVDADRNCILCQFGELRGIQGIGRGGSVEILPTVTGQKEGTYDASRDRFDAGALRDEYGLGIKYGITPSVTLDATVNPDFSQVESDADQVEVNRRFALFFPEKRPFFLEGKEIFETPFNLVHTRTIFDPIGAAKLTGKVGGTTVGLLTAVDESPVPPRGERGSETGERPDDHALFNIVRVKQDLGRTGSMGVLVTDREHAGAHNRLAALDGHLRFGEGWTVTLQGAWADTETLDGERASDPALRGAVSRSGEHLRFRLFYRDIGADFRADAGFIRRTDVREGGVWMGWQERPNGDLVLRWEPQIFYNRVYDHRGVLQDETVEPEIILEMARRTFVRASYTHKLERFAGSDFRKDRVSLGFDASPWSALSGGFRVSVGEEVNFDPDDAFLGWSRNVSAGATLRPTDRLKLNLRYTRAALWEERGGADLFAGEILRARTTYQFTRALSLRAVTEWNSFQEALDLNFLLSFEPSPGTVLFVGMDRTHRERAPEGLELQRRAIFMKASYLWRI